MSKNSASSKAKSSEKKLGIFDLISDLSYGKQDLLHDERHEVRPDIQKIFNPYMTNRAFSLEISSLLDAQLMNESFSLDSDIQYDYYLFGLRKAKRFSKWHKTVFSDEEKYIADEYKVNMRRAKEIAKLLSPQQMELIVASHTNFGGK